MYRTWSERASAACSVSRFGSGKGGPDARRSRSHNARVNGAVFDAPLSAWQAVKRSLVCRVCVKSSSVACAWLASRLRQVKRSLCMACVKLVLRVAMRRVVCVCWRALACALAQSAHLLRHALAV